MQIKLPLKSTLFNNIQRDKDSRGEILSIVDYPVNNVSIIEMNKHAFVRNNPHFLYAGKKIKIPSLNEIMNLVKNEKNVTNHNSSPKTNHIYFYGN